MRIARAFTWIYPAAVLIAGIGFQIWSLGQAAAADAYRNAPECSTGVRSACYRLVPGRITSVQVSQSRQGERDTVAIETATDGTLAASLEPSATAAPHVRTGAEVTAKLYNGHVTLVQVDGLDVPSTANPVASQGEASYAGWLLIGLGLASFGVPAYSIWRRGTRTRPAEGAFGIAEAPLEAGVLAPSTPGWSVRPGYNWTTLGRYAVVVSAVLLMSFRALVDPARMGWVILLDSIVVVGMFLGLWLFLHNTRIFADKQYVGKTNLFGRTIRLRLEEVKGADRFSVAGQYARDKHLVFVRRNGRKAFEAAGPYWDYGRLARLCRAVGIHLSGEFDEVVSVFRMNRRVPGMTGWSDLAWGTVLLLFIVVFVVLLTGPTQR